MEFYVQKQRLQDEMSRLIGIVEKKSTIPILENVLIDSNGGMGLKLRTTDLDVSLVSECLVDQIQGEGLICCSARKLYEILRLAPDGVIKIWRDPNDWVRIKSKGSSFKIPGSQGSSFPEPPFPSGEIEWIGADSKAFRSTLRGVQFAASQADDNRYAIGGVRVEINESELKMVATDGSRLSLASSPLDSLMLNTATILAPAKAVGELSKLLAEFDGEMGICSTDNGIFFRIGKRILHSRTLTGQFPNYEQAFGMVFPFFATFHADVLVQSIKRAMLVSDQRLGAVTLAFSNGQLHLDSQTAEEGECNEVIPSNFNGGDVRIACSGKYLLEFLELMGSDVIQFELKDPSYPVHIKAVKAGITYRYILMSMRDKGV